MVTMEVEVSVGANATNDNVLSTQQYMTVPFDGFLSLQDTGSATGLRRSLIIPGRGSIVHRGFVNTNNRVPIEPDDTVLEMVEVFAGQQLFLPVENTTAGALTYRARVRIEEAE